MKQVMNCHKDNGLLNMIRRTDPMINGEGQYLTNLEAKDYTAGQISRRLYGVPWNTAKVEYFIKIDVSGLNVIQNNSYNFLISGKNPLNLQGRIIESGLSVFKVKF